VRVALKMLGLASLRGLLVVLSHSRRLGSPHRCEVARDRPTRPHPRRIRHWCDGGELGVEHLHAHRRRITGLVGAIEHERVRRAGDLDVLTHGLLVRRQGPRPMISERVCESRL